MLRFTIPLFAALTFAHSGSAQEILLNDLSFVVSSASTKTASGKNRDTWEVRITTQRTADELYFTVAKTNNPLESLTQNRYMAINFANSAGLFTPKIKYLTVGKQHLLTSSYEEIYIIPQSTSETYKIEVASGKSPEVHASWVATPLTKAQVSFLKATDQEMLASAIPSRLMFLFTRPLDSMVIRRDQMLPLPSAENKKSTAEFVNGKFLVIGGEAEGTTPDYVTVAEWNGRPLFVRVANGSFETAGDKTFAIVQQTNFLQIKDPDAGNTLVKIEPAAKNVMPFNIARAAASLPSSPDGHYALGVSNGMLALLDMRTQAPPLWTAAKFGNPSGLTALIDQDHVTIRINAMPDQSGTGENNAAFLTVTNDGHIVFFRSDGYAVWRS